jgi:hypothetical protein
MVASWECNYLWLALLQEREPARKLRKVVKLSACDVDSSSAVNSCPGPERTSACGCTSLTGSCERPSSHTMPVDRLLATLLRSLQTYTDQQDTPRSVPSHAMRIQCN